MKIINILKIKMKKQYVIMFKPYLGIYELNRESKNCYYIYDKKLKRPIGYLKNKWYIIKIWGVRYGKRRV